jgi:hypothetical protein
MAASLGPIKQAVVKALRDNVALKAAVHNEFHEGISPRDVGYPYIVYDVVWATRNYTWTNNGLLTGVEIFILSDDQVEAHNLDALVIGAMHDKALDMGSSGLSVLYCRRISDESMVDLDDAGKKVYQIGGTHEILVDTSS